MDKNTRKLIILGGDKRQERLTELFQKDGYPVGRTPDFQENELIIGPVPCTRDGMHIFSEKGGPDIALQDLFEGMSLQGNLVFIAGAIKNETRALAGRYGIQTFDLMEMEEIAIANAVPTAEGAIQAAMQNSEITLFGSTCLVMGYGRCGKILAHMLKGIGAHVCVQARKEADGAYIKAYGYDYIQVDTLDTFLQTGDYDFIFNTIPAAMLDEARLKNVKRHCLVLDIASPSGGTDMDAAAALGIQALVLPGLPGKVAPVTAAHILKDTIERRFLSEG